MDKRVYIYAYAELNLGDDLFIKILCERYPHVKFYIMSKLSVSVALRKIPNLVVIPRIPFVDGVLRRMNMDMRINNIIQKGVSFYCDAIVNIGGSIFIQNKEWKDKTKNFQRRMINNKPYYVIGSNFGPYSDDKYYEKFKVLFESVTDICFREKHSYDLFSDLINVRYATDVVFSFKTKNVVKKQNHIIISVIDLSNRKELKRYKNIYQEHIINLARCFARKGYSVYLMGFCKNEGDEKAIVKILDELTSEECIYIKPYNYSGDLDEALRLIQESQCVVASRFHAMILGWVFEKPVYPIIYSDKSLHVMNDIEFDGVYTKIENINQIKVDKIIEHLIKCEPINIEKQVHAANLQFEMLDGLLMKNEIGDS